MANKAELKTTTKIEDAELFIDCVGFIIPNSAKIEASFLSEYVKTRFHNYLIQCCADNFISTKSTTDVSDVKCVEMWFAAPETASSDNMVDHGFKIIDENGDENYCQFTTSMVSFVPVRLLLNAKEGDTINIKVHGKYGKGRIANDTLDKDIEITLNVHLQQRTSRYGSFGNFEDVLNKLLA